MRLFLSFFIPAVMLGMAACSGNSGANGESAANLAAQNDSLRNQNEELGMFLNTVAECIDSISIDDISIVINSQESPVNKRQLLLNKISRISSTLESQRQKIAELSGRIDTLNPATRNLRTLIDNLKSQIESREATIADLKKQLEDKNADIGKLKTEVTGLKTEVKELNALTEQQEEALTEQDKMLNTAYVKIATQKELKECGLLTGGSIFKKKKLDTSAMDVKYFEQIDIRKKTEFDIPGKKAKVLTAMPEGSYTLTNYGDRAKLTVTNPTKFWSVSNYLIIQYK